MTTSRTLARAGLLLCGIAAAACERAPLESGPAPTEPSGPAGLARLECTVSVRTGAMACAAPGADLGGASGLIVGGPNGTYVQLTASGHTYTALDSIFSIDVTIQNLIFQPLGAVNDSTADAAGVRIFFSAEPTASVMNPPGPALPVELVNEQRGMITAANQAYFQYDGLLQPNATSNPVEWRFRLAPEVERFIFTVLVSAVVPHPDGVVQVTPAVDSIIVGGTLALSHSVVNAVGTAVADQSVAWGTSDGAVATVDAGGVVTGVGVGTATITATQGARSGSARIAVCPNLALGGVYVADMPAGTSVCLAGGAEYVLVPVNMAASSVALGLTGAGIVPVSDPPTPALLPGGRTGLREAAGLVPDDAWELRLRQMERTLRPDPGTAAPRIPGPRMAITPGVPAVGALMTLNVETDNPCTTNDLRTGRVMAVGTNVIVIADTLNPGGGFTAADYAAIADSFDARTHPVVTGAFGTPGDRDGNGRVIAFYTRAVNELTAPGSSAYVGGFFFSRDLFPAAGFSCATSNQGEMFYMLVPDPAGTVNGNVRTVAFVREKTLGTLAHEYEHLVNASRRVHVNTPWNGSFEETWLDEGLAHVAEELVFYQASGLSPRSNVDPASLPAGVAQDAFFKYAEPNFGRLRQWLLAPQSSGPFAVGDALATRGSAWAFLRYASDRRGGTEGTFWNGLVNTGNTGLANLQAVLGTDPLPWFRDFSAAMYADDAFGATLSAAEYRQPSWNFRALYTALDYLSGPACSCAYELAVRNPANGVTENVTLVAGGAAAYARVGVSAGAFAGVTVRSGSAAPGATVRMTVIRRK